MSVSQAPPRSPRPRCLGCILRAAFSNQAGSLCGGVCPGGRDPAYPKTPEVQEAQTVFMIALDNTDFFPLLTFPQENCRWL